MTTQESRFSVLKHTEVPQDTVKSSKISRFDVLSTPVPSVKFKKDESRDSHDSHDSHDFIEVYNKRSKSRFDILKKDEPEEKLSTRFSVLAESRNKHYETLKKSHDRRDFGIFKKIITGQNEKSDEKAEYYSHIKFRKEKTDTPIYEVYKTNKYPVAIDISNTAKYDELYPSTLGDSVKPVIKSVWNVKKN